MVPEAEELRTSLEHLNEADGLFKISADPRLTRVGRWRRRMSLDELPQLFNVLRGDIASWVRASTEATGVVTE